MVTEADPTTPTSVYECLDCGRQVRSATHPTRCEHCGGDLRDLSRGNE